MADKHSSEQRSYNMSQIRSVNTKPEVMVRKYLFHKGFRYRKNDKRFPGKPDIVMPKYKAIIFINGCFWHGHDGCRYFVVPKTNTDFWLAKIGKNKKRDSMNQVQLRKMGWNVITVWECEIQKQSFESTMNRVIEEIQREIKHEHI